MSLSLSPLRSPLPFVAVCAAAGALAGLAAAAVLGVAAASAHTVIRPRRTWRPAVDGWTPLEYEGEVVRFPNSPGLSLYGRLVPPPAGRPVVIVSHGFGTNRFEGEDMVPWLAAAGYGVFLFDFQAHGESEGPFTTVGLNEVDDYLSAVAYLQGRFGADVPLLAVGLSMGGAVAIMAAARCPQIRAVVADSPFATLERAVARAFKVYFRLPPRLFARPTVWFAERFTGGRVGRVKPIEEVAAIAPRPLFLVQGTADSIVDPEDSLLLFAAAGEPKQVWRVEGLDHVAVRSHFPEEYRRRVLACLAAAEELTVPEAPPPGP